ncbi:hypothetical protein D3C87_1588800 [compost metagenome]
MNAFATLAAVSGSFAVKLTLTTLVFLSFLIVTNRLSFSTPSCSDGGLVFPHERRGAFQRLPFSSQRESKSTGNRSCLVITDSAIVRVCSTVANLSAAPPPPTPAWETSMPSPPLIEPNMEDRLGEEFFSIGSNVA